MCLLQRRQAAEQKQRVIANKREFVEKMFPVLGAFRNASNMQLASTPKEEQMHKGYSDLLKYIMIVFEKFGFKEFTPGKT